MPDIVRAEYERSGKSTKINKYGMREMQERVFNARNAQYLIIKAPPASGKSRALMFIGLDKLANQGLEKVIVAVPERSIGASFEYTDLKSAGFFADWDPKPKDNLCMPGGETGKVKVFHRFMKGPDRILICTHATLRFAFEGMGEEDFDKTLIAIDEFHHVSADISSQLGELLRELLRKSKAHIVAMTGSYFRGDCIPILLPEDECRFAKVTYNYYEQLNGYTYLKSLGIGYHFYRGRYTSAISEILDTNKKTILHIPNVNAGESTKDKHKEVDTILDVIGDVVRQDKQTGVIFVKRKQDNKIIKVADLVYDEQKERDKIVNYLRKIKKVDDIDLIIALGMAKEGFDWPYCEHALTVGYRGSLTEIIQIIGRCTRDSDNKTHTQFTNLIAQPDASDDVVKISVNNMLKAITCSLLMEQVIAPNFKFKTKKDAKDKSEPGVIVIEGLKEPTTEKVKEILESDINDLKASLLQDDDVVRALYGTMDPEVINKYLTPKIIQRKYPDLSTEEVEVVRQHLVTDSVVKRAEIKEIGGQRFIKMAGEFVDIDKLSIDLIDSINPFQQAFEILSKSVTPQIFRVIQETIELTRMQMTLDEAIILWPKIKAFVTNAGSEPQLNSSDPLEKRLAEALVYLRNEKRKMVANG